ncbi:hypothetical protein L4D09_12855 [Photobacterium makurazakiensis]|uniref:hypothetical protein n=1 Tax=Photobacterium makurazakiensis TaxID=2910234 RepID=UPI003D0F4578
MEQPSKSLSQTISYLKHCTTQLVVNRVAIPSEIINKRTNEIASIEYLELEQAGEQIVQLQKTLFRALHALDAKENEDVKESLIHAIKMVNSDLSIPVSKSTKQVKNALSEPSLAG